MRRLFAFVLLGTVLATTACGGGGGGSSAQPSTVAATPAVTNVQPISVDPGPAGMVDVAFTSVTICSPGNPANCQTIDHVQIDTGSSGLRIMASVLSLSLSLPQQTDPAGSPLVECAQFADGYTWGPVKTADIKIAGEAANAVPVQIIGDPAFDSLAPASCSNGLPPENTVQSLGANGVLGIGVFKQDCGSGCASSAIPGFYYLCPSTGCQPTALGLTQQLQNPVALFAGDNNGVLIEFPAVPAAGAATLSGSLVFGIGTQTNNALGSAKVFTVDPNTGNLITLFNNQTYSSSYMDSGSNGFFFADGSIPDCMDAVFFYCPAATLNLSAVIQGINGTIGDVGFSVANADMLFSGGSSGYAAFADLAGTNSDSTSFAWGLPFFFGRTIFTAIEGQNTAAGMGPYVAF
jgi:hypothetical protein